MEFSGKTGTAGSASLTRWPRGHAAPETYREQKASVIACKYYKMSFH